MGGEDRLKWLPTLLALACAGCGGDAGQSGAEPNGSAGGGGTVVVCVPNQPAGLDPFTSADLGSADLIPLLYTPVLRYGESGEMRPGLAREWSWDENHRSLTLRLRDDVRWHDGTPVTAEDVAWTLRVAADTTYAYVAGQDFFELTDVSVPEPGTVELHFGGPPVGVMEGLAQLPILPHHLLGELSPEAFARAAFHTAPVGSGPYRFGGRRGDGSLLFERVAEFPEELGRGGVERILLRIVPERSTQLVELRTGSVHGCVLGASAAQDVAAATTLRSVVVGPASVQALPLRVDRPPFEDERVRRALSAALDRAELATLISPIARPAGSFIPAGSPFRADSLAQPDADSALAGALLDSAGWRRSGDGSRRDADGRPFAFTIVGPQAYQDLLTAVQGQLRRVGADVRLQMMEGSAYLDIVQDPERRPGAMALAFTPTKLQGYDPFAELHSDGSVNLSSYRNPRADSLIEALRAEPALEGRGPLFLELQRLISRDAPVLYLIYTSRLFALRPELQGVEVDPSGPFASVSDWRLAD